MYFGLGPVFTPVCLFLFRIEFISKRNGSVKASRTNLGENRSAPFNARRAARNVHFYRDVLDPGHRVFIGSKRYSALFPKAVDLEINQNSGLLFRTVKSANGERLSRNGKIPWYSATRSCRAIWDLDYSKHRATAKIARDVILRKTGYDLLLDINL